MGKLITVIGNSGVGKSTLVKRLADVGSFTPILESTDDRPFLSKFKNNLSAYCLANQVDFFLYHAENARIIVENDIVGIQDGGLDFSFNVFTKRFHQKGYLNDEEFFLCERLYNTLRSLLPTPDLMIILEAPYQVIAERMKRRGREIDIERSQDLIELENLIEKWVKICTSVPSIRIDASRDDPTYAVIIDNLIKDIRAELLN